jgi:hypothetical protein
MEKRKKKLWYDRKKNEQGMSRPYGAVKSKGAESPLHRKITENL